VRGLKARGKTGKEGKTTEKSGYGGGVVGEKGNLFGKTGREENPTREEKHKCPWKVRGGGGRVTLWGEEKKTGPPQIRKKKFVVVGRLRGGNQGKWGGVCANCAEVNKRC